MTKQFSIFSFKYGLDTRREELTSQPGTLQTLQDCFVNSGGEIEKRKGFFYVENQIMYDTLYLRNGYGLEVTSAGLVTFGHAAPFGATPLNSEPVLLAAPTILIYQQLRHPSLVNDTTETFSTSYHVLAAVPFSFSFRGYAFAAATFADGRTFLYYNGTLIQHSANGIVMTGRIALADLANDLLRQVQAIDWVGEANVSGDAIEVASITRVAQTATATTKITHGYTTGDIVEHVGALENEYNGKFTITVTNTTQYTYTIVGSPVATTATTLTGILSIKSSVTQNGSVTVKSPSGNFTTLIPSDTSTAGYMGVKKIGVNSQATNGAQALAAFQIDNNTGTFTLAAPAQITSATPTIDLCGGAVSGIGADSAANRVLTAQAIVQAVNDLTFAHGYSALSRDNSVFIYAPIGYDITIAIDLTVTVTTGTVSASAVAPVNLTISLTPSPQFFEVFNDVPSDVSGVVSSAVSGGTTPYTYLWEAVSNLNNILISAPTEASTSFSKFMEVDNQQLSGNFKLKVIDALSAETTIFFTVTLKRSKV